MRYGRTGRMTRRGFSLLELLAVMSIMAMLATIAVTSYFSAIRGMARRSASKHLADTLVFARQRACLEGSRMSVMIYNEVSGYDKVAGKDIVTPTYTVCKEIGRVSNNTGGKLIDEFTALDGLFPTINQDSEKTKMGDRSFMRIYNLTQGGWWNVYPVVLRDESQTGRASAYAADRGFAKSYVIPAFAFLENRDVVNLNKPPNGWIVNDAYGVEAAPANTLPRGIWFQKLQDQTGNGVISATFLPDGTTLSDVEIRLQEENPPRMGVTISVKRNDGSITYTEKWTP